MFNMKTKLPLLHVVAAVLLAPFGQTFADPPVTFDVLSTFNYPGAVTTTLTGINAEGDVAGFFTPDNSATDGFIRFRNSLSTPITEPNDHANTTRVNDINDDGTICGYYQRADFHWYGFTASGGTFSEVNSGALDTYVVGVNNAGNTCGYTGNPSGPFVIIDGTANSFAIPGADYTIAVDINNLNQCVGYYAVGQRTFGFRRDADGTFTYPITRPGAIDTYLFGINDNGLMVGFVYDSAGAGHAIFFQSPDKSAIYDYPGAVATSFWGINNRGVISGSFGNEHTSRNFIARVKPVSQAR